MAMENTKKTILKAGSLGLYEFIHMLFGLSNVSSSFSHLMKQCFGDQQFITLLLYLDDICIFAPDLDTMLGQIEMAFTSLINFHLKSKPKTCFIVQSRVILFSILSLQMIFQLAQKIKLTKFKIGLCQRTPRSYSCFLALPLITFVSSPNSQI